MENHISYEQKLKRSCDFVVKYRFLTKEEGGRQTLPLQGVRFDFMYFGDSPEKDSIYIIHPEFLNNSHQVITEKIMVPEKGNARMWIVNRDYLDYHKERLKIGTKGYFMEGPKIIAECNVIKLIGLL